MADTFRSLALSLPEATENAHFEKISFRVKSKIFATMDAAQSRATVKLSAADQDIFCTFDNMIIYPVPNKWGKQGWTHINLHAIPEHLLLEVLKAAYCGIAPAHLAALVIFE
jgi:predicted DNA-binding protein (MmcQ/YjbR family)